MRRDEMMKLTRLHWIALRVRSLVRGLFTCRPLELGSLYVRSASAYRGGVADVDLVTSHTEQTEMLHVHFRLQHTLCALNQILLGAALYMPSST